MIGIAFICSTSVLNEIHSEAKQFTTNFLAAVLQARVASMPLDKLMISNLPDVIRAELFRLRWGNLEISCGKSLKLST